jgi:AcrR family transcriptional regulator
MTTPSRVNGLRIDAVRNVERIASAAEEVFARAGSNAAMDDIAAARLGIATVYRRFPSKEQLLNAVLDRRFDDVVVSALRRSGDIARARRCGLRSKERSYSSLRFPTRSTQRRGAA